MSELTLNIPVTFESGALLKVNDECINRIVQNIEGKFSEMTSYANAMSMYVKNNNNDTVSYNGITLTEDKLILDASYVKIGGTNFFTLENGKAYIDTSFISASYVSATEMITTNNDIVISINNGIIKAQSTNNSYIEFGVDNLGYMTLKYVESNGNIKYELSPYTPFANELIVKNIE